MYGSATDAVFHDDRDQGLLVSTRISMELARSREDGVCDAGKGREM